MSARPSAPIQTMQAKAEAPTIEAVTALVSPDAANIERVGFAVLGVVIKALDDAGTAAGANGLNVNLDAQLVADIKSIASTVKSAAPVTAAKWQTWYPLSRVLPRQDPSPGRLWVERGSATWPCAPRAEIYGKRTQAC